MKALVCEAPGRLVLEDRPEPPPPPPGWALIDVAYVGICGTDFHIFEGKHPFLEYPRVMGHEVSGVVREAGEGVALVPGTPVIVNPYFACGRCIACRNGKPNACARIEVLGVHRDGAMCERILVPESNLYPAGDLSLRDAAAVEFLAIGAHAVRRAGAREGSRALVIGAGPIGLGTAVFARLAGLAVTLLDTSPERLAFAERELGLATLDPGRQGAAQAVMEATDGEGFETVFDATGNPASITAAFAHVSQGGSLVLVSVVKNEITFSDPEFHKREMTLIGSRNALRPDFGAVAQAIGEGGLRLDRMVTHKQTLDEVATEFPHLATTRKGLIKAVIEVGST